MVVLGIIFGILALITLVIVIPCMIIAGECSREEENNGQPQDDRTV